jgi:DNA-binding MarR family transcriptional regulator
MNFEQADALNEVIRAVGVRHRALAIAALAPFGIHPGHKLLLFELDTAGACTQAQLAAATGFEPPTITLSTRQLEDAGLVIRRPSPADRRATLVQLSDKGRVPARRTDRRRLHLSPARPAHRRPRRPGRQPRRQPRPGHRRPV